MQSTCASLYAQANVCCGTNAYEYVEPFIYAQTGNKYSNLVNLRQQKNHNQYKLFVFFKGDQKADLRTFCK